MYFHRRLCLAVLSPELDKVSCLTDKAAATEKFYHQHQDHGATYFFHRTKVQANLPVYGDRAAMAYCICRVSVKLSYLDRLMYDICTTNLRKVIISCDWPSTSCLVEVLNLYHTGVEVFVYPSYLNFISKSDSHTLNK